MTGDTTRMMVWCREIVGRSQLVFSLHERRTADGKDLLAADPLRPPFRIPLPVLDRDVVVEALIDCDRRQLANSELDVGILLPKERQERDQAFDLKCSRCGNCEHLTAIVVADTVGRQTHLVDNRTN